MSSMLTVRNIPDKDKAWLKRAADRSGRSMEAEVRRMIAEARRGDLGRRQDEPFSAFVERLFGKENGFELEVPKLRGRLRVPDFSDAAFDGPGEGA